LSEIILTAKIISLSNSDKWESAKDEWGLFKIFESGSPQKCLCGHYPIHQVCIIKNYRNKNTAKVGNCCVKKFMGLPSDKIFKAVKRVRENIEKSLNIETLVHAWNEGWIFDWEYDFYNNIMLKRALSKKQAERKKQINDKILFNMKRE